MGLVPTCHLSARRFGPWAALLAQAMVMLTVIGVLLQNESVNTSRIAGLAVTALAGSST